MTTDRWFFGWQFATALACGLVGGVFFAFSNFVMQALARLPAAQGIAAMNSINVTVINPLFMALLFGTGLACLVLAGGSLLDWQSNGSAYVLAGSLLYVVGTVLVTMICNVPLNNALANVAPDSAEAAQVWAHHLTNWVWWNHVRTAASLAAAACLSWGLR